MLKQLLRKKEALEEEKKALYASIEPKAVAIADQIMKLDEQITSLIMEPVNMRRRAENKDTGIVNVELHGVLVKHDIPKRVKWDEKILAAKVEQIKQSGADPTEYVQINYKVPESKYKAWPNAIKEIFVAARTVEVGTPKITFVIQDADAAPALPENVISLAGRG